MKPIHICLLAVLLLVGCSPARVVDVSWIQYDEGILTRADLAQGKIALMPIRAVSGWESHARPFAQELSRAFGQTFPDITYIRWETAAQRLNQAGVAELYAAALDFQRRTGIPDARATKQIGEAVDARYVLVVLIEGEIDPYVRGFLAAQAQIWDCREGAIVWEGVGASELHGRDGYVAGADFSRTAAQGLVRIMPGAGKPPESAADTSASETGSS